MPGARVELALTVCERCRFVTDIGEQIEPVWNEYRRFQETKTAACMRLGDVELTVQNGEVRFAVNSKAWAGGLMLEDVVTKILRECGSSPRTAEV